MATAESVVHPPVDIPRAETVTLGMWLQFLFGGREAILQFARCPHALWLGLLFVLSTGFAREYDGADLRSEPWHLALPLVASLGTSLILWSLVYLAAIRRGLEQMGFWAGYRTLLTFYWMTAPLAWIYAIPVERFMSPADATATNFYFLAVVAAWRVLLITRSLAVWLNASFFALFFLVALFADSVAALLALASPMPIFNVMGGIRHSAVDRVILDVLMNTQILGVISWPVWLVGALVILVRKSPWSVATISLSMSRVAVSLWTLSIALVALGIAILPLGQSQQRHASQAAALLHSQEIDSAVRYMAKLKRTDLPPIWDPPPRIGYGENSPDVVAVLESIAEQTGPEWLSEVYIEKLNVDPRSSFESAIPHEGTIENSRLTQLLSIYEQFVPLDNIDQLQREELINMAGDRRVDADTRKRMLKYLKWPPANHADESSPAERPSETQP